MDADGEPSHVILGDAVRPDEAQRFRKGQRPLPVTSHATRVPPRRRDPDRSAAYLAAGVGLVLVAWAMLNLAVDRARFVTFAPETQIGVAAASSIARLVGALGLLLVPDPTAGRRLRWVASGIVVLGLGGFGFGYLPSLVGVRFSLNTLMCASLLVWSIAGLLFVAGLSDEPPRFSRRVVVPLALVLSALLAIVIASGQLPPLVHIANVQAAVASEGGTLPGLTPWHWALSIIPLGLAVAATLGAVRHAGEEGLGRWLVLAMTLLAGAQVHNLFWPSTYSPILTTADILRLAFAATTVVGGVLALRRIAAQRAVLLAGEQDASRSLVELALMRADFSAMVAHELSAPIAAVRRASDLLALDALSPLQQGALATIRVESDVLTTLVVDVQTIATIERDDFAVRLQSLAVADLLADAVAFGASLPGNHPVQASDIVAERVLADRERIGQVLRNLVGNAAKYSAPGTPIVLRATRSRARVRIEVVDQGFGIHPDDLTRVFEKFGRGRDQHGRSVPGVGLGLYLSRRIVQAHGSDLSVTSAVGEGSSFGFDLETAR